MNKVANMPLRKYLPRDLWQCLPSQSTCENTQRGEDVGEGRGEVGEGRGGGEMGEG